jgi:hypothetical protein
MLGIAQYATGMIDETQRLFYVALAIARFRVILANQSTQRGPHLFIRGALRNPKGFVKRRFHGRERGQNTMKFDVGIFR